MNKQLFGTLPDGTAVELYTLQNEAAKVEIITFGGAIRSFVWHGISVVGGFDTLASYLKDDSHQGALIGRVANRVAQARFEMDGATYTLFKNDGSNCLHGGKEGFDRKVWQVCAASDSAITLSYFSKDGEEGFPGALTVKVTYTLSDTTLLLEYEAVPEAKTPIALTNHSYFNLDGFGGTICHHRTKIYANAYSEIDENMIPFANLPVQGTVFDFTEPHEIGERIGGDFIGYDHNFVLAPTKTEQILGKELPLAAEVEGEKLCMKVYTDTPGIQFYIGNFLGNGEPFAGGIPQVRHGAFCLEAQTEPNIINHGGAFYDKGEIYRQITAYRIEKK